MPKGVYPHTHIKPREYPAEIVEAVREMYVGQGMTVLEVQARLPKGYKAQRIIERHIPVRRKPAKRNQRGAANSSWRGGSVSYAGVHARLVSWFGSASSHTCADCGSSAHDWSYEGGCPDERRDPETGCPFTTDLNQYKPRCRSCHRQHDRKGGGANVR